MISLPSSVCSIYSKKPTFILSLVCLLEQRKLCQNLLERYTYHSLRAYCVPDFVLVLYIYYF